MGRRPAVVLLALSGIAIAAVLYAVFLRSPESPATDAPSSRVTPAIPRDNNEVTPGLKPIPREKAGDPFAVEIDPAASLDESQKRPTSSR
jgi:hypothetical protein